jgi:hypothetical protein
MEQDHLKLLIFRFLRHRFAYPAFASVIFIQELKKEPELFLREGIEYGQINRYF